MAEQMDLAQMMVRLGVAEGDIAKLTRALGEVNTKFEETGEHAEGAKEKVEEAGEGFGAFKSPVLEAVFAVHAFIDEIRETIAVLGELSGVKVATEYVRLSNALDNVTHSARQTKEIMEQIEGIHSPYLNSLLIGYAPKLVNSGISTQDVGKDLKSITNLGAEGNLSNDEMGSLLEELTKMRSEDHPMIRQLSTQFAGLPIMDVVNKGAGTKFTNSNQAYDYLEGMRGTQAYDVLLKGADALNPVAGALLLMKDPAMAFAKSLETIKEIMKPTGQLILPILGAAVSLLSDLAGWFNYINSITGGGAGLVALTMLVVKGFRLLVDTFYAVIRFTRDLTQAVEKYGEAAEGAAVRTAVHGGEEAAAGGMAASAGEKEAAEAGAGAAGAAGAGFASKIKTWLAKMLGHVKGGGGLGILGFAGSMGLGMYGDAHQDSMGGSVAGGASSGMFVGDMIAMITPGVWKLLPLLGGALIGGILGARDFHGKSKEDKQTDATEKNTAALQELHGRLIGGGERGRAAASQIQVEYAVARAMSLGVG